MHYGPRFRLTPPWPPGLESIRKSLLGPVRYRSTSISTEKPVPPYDDTLLIALALNAFLDGKTNGFSLNAPAFELDCRFDTKIDSATLNQLQNLIDDADVSTQGLNPNPLISSRIQIRGSVGAIQIEHSSWIARVAKGGKTLKWNPAFRGALELLQARRIEAL